jgi:hypothetical protein
MSRRTCLLWILVGCAGARPPAAHLFASGGGECADPAGCEVPIEEGPRFERPDAEHGPPEEPGLGPAGDVVATCRDVGESLAALEVGNYADDAARSPVVARYTTRCTESRLDREARQCAFAAEDQLTVEYCAPSLMSLYHVPLVAPRNCIDITNQIRAKHALPDQDEVSRRLLATLLTSCEQDRWTLAFGMCARNVATAAYVMGSCQQIAPTPLRKKLEDRLAALR